MQQDQGATEETITEEGIVKVILSKKQTRNETYYQVHWLHSYIPYHKYNNFSVTG